MLFSIFLWWNGEIIFQNNRSWFQSWSTHRNIFLLKILNFFHSFKLIFFNVVAVWFGFAHSVHRIFFNIMPLPAPVRAIRWPSDSGCGDAYRSKFVRCIDGCNPEVHKGWIWGDDGITPKVRSTVRFDVNPWITRDFATNYFTETGSRTTNFSKNLLMEVLIFSALLIHWGPAGSIGLKISCVPVHVRESEVLLKIWIGGVYLEVDTSVLASCGMEPYLPV